MGYKEFTIQGSRNLITHGNPDLRSQYKIKTTVENGIDSIFEELRLSIYWKRPSILLAVFTSDFVRSEVEADLKHRLSEMGQNVKSLLVDEESYDVSKTISQIGNYRKTVFFVSGLKWGGGRRGLTAYHALNLGREYFVDKQIRVLFWLTKIEARVLPHQAPDFWAYRHRVIEFNNIPARGRIYPSKETLEWEMHESVSVIDDIEGMIVLRDSLLNRLPKVPESTASRAGLLYELAYLFWIKKEYERSFDLLRLGHDLVSRTRDSSMQSRFWIGLGNIHYIFHDCTSAISAFQKAIGLNSANANAWSNLAIVYRNCRLTNKSVMASKKAIELNPGYAEAWNNLANAYRDLGMFEDALAAYQSAIRLSKNNTDFYINLSNVFRDINRNPEALRAIKKCIKLDPKDRVCWKNLGELYQLLEQPHKAIHAYNKVLMLDANDNHTLISLTNCYGKLNMKKQYSENINALRNKMLSDIDYNKACFESICGNSKKAIKLLKTAIIKKQMIPYLIEQDPNFEHLREDPRFLALLHRKAGTK